MEPAPAGRIMAISTGVAMGVGIGFGLYPAWTAARMDPVAALRAQDATGTGSGARHRLPGGRQERAAGATPCYATTRQNFQ